MKPPGNVTISEPLVTVISRAVVAALLAMLTFTVRLLEADAVAALAVTPVPLKVTADALVKCVKLPVMVTGRLLCPCWPVFGLILVMTGVPGSTVKALSKVTNSEPVVTVTLRAPSVALPMVTFTVRLVAVAAVGALAATAAPLKVTTDALLKWVKLPVMVTAKPVCPCWPLLGLADNRTGVPAVTVKPLVSVSTWLPVVSTIVREPVAAAESMLITAVALVEEFTVNDATVIPVPKLAVVVPCTQLVNWPTSDIVRLC